MTSNKTQNIIQNHDIKEQDKVLDPKVKYYFNHLDDLGDFSPNDPNKTVDRVNVGLVKVGARPVSGVRGLYFSKGMWKVKYFDDDLEIITCLFRYGDRETLIQSYHSARNFLRKVIQYGRQIHEDDGTVLEELNDKQLIDLDERKSKKMFLLDHTSVYDKPLNRYIDSKVMENFSIKRARMNSNGNSKQNETSSEQVIKKKKKILHQNTNGSNTTPTYGPGRKKLKDRKLTKFEEKFLKYSDCSTLKMINKIIEENRQDRLKENGKIYSLKNRCDSNFREMEDIYIKMFGNDYYLSNVGDDSVGEVLKQTSFKGDIDEKDVLINGSDKDNNILKNGNEYIEDESLFCIKSYNFDNCFKK